ncbi:MAG TPA: hypothetical protein VIY56_18155, partial [Vicinamibacterales bacterium]
MHSRTSLAVASVVAIGLAGVLVTAQNGPKPDAAGDWPMYSLNLAGQRFSPLDQITPDNVATLQ